MLHGVADKEQGDWAETTSDELIQLADKKTALVIGPGLGRFPQDDVWLRAIWEKTRCSLVLDADALNIIADATDFASWQSRDAAVILTPHPGEMARLLGVPVHEVQRDRIGLARRYALQHGVTLVLKGTRTVCATPEGVVYVNTTGNPGMATAGAGDVLAGMLGSLLAQNLTAEQAVCLGVYLHGAAGDRAAAKRHSTGSLIASDIIGEL
jgi:NAD(P)H-hydrate epimerase